MLDIPPTSETKSQECLTEGRGKHQPFSFSSLFRENWPCLWPVDPSSSPHSLHHLLHLQAASLQPSSQLTDTWPLDPSTFHISFSDASSYSWESHPQSSRLLPLCFYRFLPPFLIPLKHGTLCKEQAVNCGGFMGHMHQELPPLNAVSE